MREKNNLPKNFEDMPKRSPMHRHSDSKDCHCIRCFEDGDNDLNRRKIKKFLRSRVGQYWDKIVSEFINLPWVPLRFRKSSFLNHYVEVNTFKQNDRIKYNDSVPMFGKSVRDVEEGGRFVKDFFYVHPESKCLCVGKR